MSAEELLRLLTSVLFAGLFAAVAGTAARTRRRADLDAALLFGAFAVVFMQTHVTAALGIRLAPPFSTVLTVAVLALPYLLLRLVDDFAGVPRRIMRGALGGLALMVVVITALPAPLPSWFTLPLIAYFVVLEIYAAVRFVQESRRSTGVTRRRMQAAAGGSFLFGLTIGVAGLLPLVVPGSYTALTMTLALASALAYVVAFSPPRLLRRAWREPELRAFLARAVEISPLEETVAIARRLEERAAAALGANGAEIALWDEAAGELRLMGTGARVPAEDAAARAFASQRPLLQDHARDRAAPEALLAAAISVRGRRIGVLSVHARRGPVFADDALELAQLLAEQAGLIIDGVRVYGELAALNRQLTDATRAKSEFLATMSHELRTPLNAILGFSELLTEQIGDSLTDRRKRYLRNIREAGEHLLALINDVLDLSKVEAGRLELRPERLTLARLLEPVLQSTRAAADARGVLFDADSFGDVDVRLDPSRMRQVLFNLLSNAVKFTESGGRVAFRVRLQDAALELEIADTGIGIPADKRVRVFGMFERLNEGRSDAPGTGLGLALTKRLVELHGGSIAFESEEGRGTTFRVRVPDVVSEPAGGERLLVVEDEPRDGDLICALAGAAGLGCEVATTVDEARAAIRREAPLAVVLDLRLHGVRGEPLLEELKANSDTRQIPVIVVSVEDDEGRSRPLGADDHLTKPIDHERLAGWLRQVASRKEALRAHPAR
jgi:signal transduction histidine kinase/ActR/RegA family two-component response regulator